MLTVYKIYIFMYHHISFVINCFLYYDIHLTELRASTIQQQLKVYLQRVKANIPCTYIILVDYCVFFWGEGVDLLELKLWRPLPSSYICDRSATADPLLLAPFNYSCAARDRCSANARLPSKLVPFHWLTRI